MAYVKKRSVLPVYFVGGTWLAWALFAPLYRPSHYIMAALASLVAYYGGKMIFPDRGCEMEGAAQAAPQEPPRPASPREEKPKSTGNPEIDALLAERGRAVGEMRRLNDSIEDPQISAQITHLETTTGKIIDAVAASPSKLPKIRKFMNYYLPTTLKLLNAYDRMDSTGVSGANIDGGDGADAGPGGIGRHDSGQLMGSRHEKENTEKRLPGAGRHLDPGGGFHSGGLCALSACGVQPVLAASAGAEYPDRLQLLEDLSQYPGGGAANSEGPLCSPAQILGRPGTV